MPDATQCPECGAPLPGNWPKGLCSRCALQGALELTPSAATAPGGPPIPASVAEQPGDHIGRYKLLEKIGEGGCGVVYMAEQEEPVRRRVALKIIKPGMDTREVIARFEAERQALALMEHPHIAKIFDGGATEAGRPYFVMELVRGLRITEYCDRKKLSTRQRLDLFMQVCQAVQHAHQKGVIHRDLKPSNILVTVNDGVPVPKVIDFGIAKATGQRLTEKTFFTRFQQFIGTPAYMSPEQAEMTSLDIDTRSDIYSLGVLLYELLTGRTPFDTKELLRAGMEEMLRTIREQEPVRPSARLSTLAADEQTTVARQRQTESPKLIRLLRGDLDWMVMMCLEKDRARRYETANALALDIQRHLENEPVVACPPSVAYRFRKWVRRNKLAFAAASAVAGALVLGVLVSTWQAVRATRAQRAADTAREQQAQLRLRAETAEHDTREQLWNSHLAQARAERATPLAGRRDRALAATVAAARLRASLEVRNEAIAALAMSDLGATNRWIESVSYPTNGVPALRSYDANLERYAVAAPGVVKIFRSHDHRELAQLPATDDTPTKLQFSPEGEKLVAVFRQGSLSVWNIAQQTMIFHTNAQLVGPGMLRFSPNSRYLVAGNPGSDLTVWDLSRESVDFVVRKEDFGHVPGRNAAIVFKPDGRMMAVARTNGVVDIVDLAGARDVRPLNVGVWSDLGSYSSAADVQLQFGATHFNSTWTRLAVKDQQRIQIWDLGTRQLLRSLDHTIPVREFAWHPDGRCLAAMYQGGELRLWDVETGESQGFQGGVGEGYYPPQFHPDGRLLLLQAGGSTQFWDVANGRHLFDWFAGGRFDADGSLQFFGTGSARDHTPGQGRRVVINSSVFRRMGVVRQIPSVHNALAISPDGRWIAAGGEEGCRLWDRLSGNSIAVERTKGVASVLFHPDGRSLFIGSLDGLERFPLKGLEGSEPLSLGAAEVFARRPLAFSLSPDGEMLAILELGGISLVHLQDPARNSTFPTDGQYMMKYLALSTNKRWLCGWGSWTGSTPEPQVFDAQNGRLVSHLQGEVVAKVVFSPDGRTLLTCGTRDYAFWDTATWQPRQRLVHTPAGATIGSAAFTADGKLLALAQSRHEVQLLDPRTGESLATLTAPDPENIRALSFSADGAVLAAAVDRGGIQIWNLAELRRELGCLGLDWPDVLP